MCPQWGLQGAGFSLLGEVVWAVCNGMLKAARSWSGTEWPVVSQLTLGTSGTGNSRSRAGSGLRSGRPVELLVFVGAGFRDLEVGQLANKKWGRRAR